MYPKSREIYIKPTFGYSSLAVKNEDRIIITKLKEMYICGIYDGHGGDNVVNFIKKNLIKYFLESKKTSNLLKIKDVYAKIETELKQNNIVQSGSTASTIIITPTDILICHVGDSRIISLKNKLVKQLTIDHKPNNINEYKRIKTNNEKIRFTGVYRIGPLSVSRTLGDLNIKNTFKSISSVPETKKLKNINFSFFVLGSDGLFDVMTNTEILTFICNRLEKFSLMKIASELTKYAKYTKNSADDISVIIIKN
jgi:serine/threonine protein phosphatase PrpC